jgi:hypothetical protein
MRPVHEPRVRDRRILVSSPRCLLSCEALSIHLPALPNNQDHSRPDKYISSPMSTPSKHSRHFPTASSHSQPYPDPRILPQPSHSNPIPSQSRGSIANRPRPRVLERDISIATSNVANDSGGSFHPRGDPQRLRENSLDQLSFITPDSLEGQQLLAGPPGIARRAKAHVPSACVNCKRKHLACETGRPCNRCIQTGKEVRSPESVELCF